MAISDMKAWIFLSCFALLLTNAAIGKADESKPPVKFDQDGEPLPQGAIARLGSQHFRLGFTATGYSITYSPDGQQIIVGGSAFPGTDGSPIKVFDSATGKTVISMRAHAHVVRAVAVSADGKFLASGGGDGRMAVWEMVSGKRLWLGEHGMGGDTIAFLGNTKTLAADEGGSIRLIDATTGKPGLRIDTRKAYLSVTSTPDGKLLASCGDGDKNVRVWESETGKPVRSYMVQEDRASYCTFSPDSKLLASCTHPWPTGGLYLWEVATGKQLCRIPLELKCWRLAGFSPDASELYVFGEELRVLDTATGRELRRFRLPCDMFLAAVAPDGRTMACMAESTRSGLVRLVDLKSGAVRTHGSGRPINSLAFSPDGRSLATASGENEISIWDPSSGKLLKSLPTEAKGVAWSRDGSMLATVGDNSLKLWDAVLLNLKRSINPEPAFAGFAPTGGHISFLADNRQLVYCARSGRITLIDTASGQIEKAGVDADPERRSAASGPLDTSFAVSRNSNKIAIDRHWHAAIIVWDPKTNQKVLDTSIIKGSVLAFSPSGDKIAAFTEAGIVLVDGRTGKTLHLLPGTRLWIGDFFPVACFSPDGRTVASSSESGKVVVWEAATGKERRTFAGHGQKIRSITFSPDGKRLATGSEDTTVLIWDVDSR